MASLKPAKDIIKALPPGIQLTTTKLVADELQRQQTVAAEELAKQSAVDIIAATPGMTLDDADQLIGWQEKRESGRPVDVTP